MCARMHRMDDGRWMEEGYHQKLQGSIGVAGWLVTSASEALKVVCDLHYQAAN
jgi:hypothetical protein